MKPSRVTPLEELPCWLPHGPDMLLVDRVESLAAGQSLVAVHTVRAGEPCFATGAAYPPALVLESMGQAAVLLWMASTTLGVDLIPMLAVVRGFRMFRQVWTGDALRHRVTLHHRGPASAMVSATSEVRGTVVAQVDSLLAVGRTPAELPTPACDLRGATTTEENRP
ncbi:hypothetical protein AB0H36_33920 [Kribbella sp. NPDC050820]|uniref:3-hydroxyacyl-ACP dehydratase FabZ family protein n=1 Tax=Kribbella sp. NPDC050820 TaxID=3155408 RepID=UPI00340C77FF